MSCLIKAIQEYAWVVGEELPGGEPVIRDFEKFREALWALMEAVECR